MPTEKRFWSFSFLYFRSYCLCSGNFNMQVINKNEKPDYHCRYEVGDSLQWTARNLRWKLKFRDMGFFQKILIYQTHGEFAEKSEGFGRFSRRSEHVFHRCGQLRSSTEFLLVIGSIWIANFYRGKGGMECWREL